MTNKKIRLYNDKSLRTIDDNGFLHIEYSPILKSGILEYYGEELLEGGDDNIIDGVEIEKDKLYKVYISPEELEKSKDTFIGKPIVNNHQWLGKEGENAKDYQEGSLGENLFIKGNLLMSPMFFNNLKTVEEIQNNEKVELSASYSNKLKKSNNKDYDFIATDIVGNHIALVEKGRCGSDVRVYNSKSNKIDFFKNLKEFIKNYDKINLSNGGAGSGNWGHSGRKGKVGGSGKEAGTPTEHQKERRAYGRRLREIAEAFRADNIGKKYKKRADEIFKEVKRNRGKQFLEKIHQEYMLRKTQEADEKGRIKAMSVEEFDKYLREEKRFSYGYTGKYKDLSDNQLLKVLRETARESWSGNAETEAIAERLKRGYDSNNKLIEAHKKPQSEKLKRKELTEELQKEQGYKILKESPKGAKLIEKDGKTAWVMAKQIRADGSLTAGALSSLKEGKSKEEYNKQQEQKEKIKQIREDYNKKIDEEVKNKGYDLDNDNSHQAIKDLKKELSITNTEVFNTIKNKNIELPDNVNNILKSDHTAKLKANYWQTPDGSKKRIYFNIFNQKGYRYSLNNNFIEL